MKCKLCRKELWLEGIKDDIPLCHPCYVKVYSKENNEYKS